MIQQYEIIRVLGRGGSGIVYLAKDIYLNRLVAMKKIAKTEGDMKKEAEALQQYRHPLLPVIYQCVMEEECYLVMEYIEGVTLTEYIQKYGYADSETARRWGLQILSLLAFLHSRNTPVVYRDLKPDNLMITKEGKIRVVDMGAILVRTFGAGRQGDVLAASPGYAAPEQWKDIGLIDERTDIYAFGKVLYYMLTAANLQNPPYSDLPISVYQPLVDRCLEKVILRCIKENPKERYQTVAEIKQDMNKKFLYRILPGKHTFIRSVERSLYLTEAQTKVYF